MSNCSLSYYKDIKFVDWPLKEIKDCFLNKGKEIGNYIWKGHETIGLFILIALLIVIYYAYKSRRNK